MMQQRWTLRVEGLGPIREASLRVAPLMILTGENNTGKTYLAAFLWGMATVAKNLFISDPDRPPDWPELRLCDEWLQEIWGKTDFIDGRVQGFFIDLWNVFLKESGNALSQRIFGDKKISVGAAAIMDFQGPDLILDWKSLRGVRGYAYAGSERGIDIIGDHVEADDVPPPLSQRMEILRTLAWRILLEGIVKPSPDFHAGGRGWGEPVFLPAARTGYMANYRLLVSAFVGQGFETDEDESIRTSEPMMGRRFLQSLIQITSKRKGDNNDLATWIEQDFLHGKVEVSSTVTLPVFSYRADHSDRSIPPQASSSLVTELTPLVLALRHLGDFSALFLEEPEAHLHPALQAKMGRLIARLVQRGITTCITTHSDILMQEINNLIKMGEHTYPTGALEEMGMSLDEAFQLSEVSGCEFRRLEDGRSSGTVMEATPDGLLVSLMNEALADLTEETLALYREREEDVIEPP